eukprot:GGOE01032462.1.p1 GENE.GGOE01032462.1~~GGOE01032462.1.p1  ORF type:complete len:1208 (-),score=384.12 GGOE01032462.1:131-3667(-)
MGASHFLLVVVLLASMVQSQDITIGMSAPLFSDGNLFADGMQFAFLEANAAGGIASRNVTLLPLNDNYDVTTGVANVLKLIDEKQVFLLAGLVGTSLVSNALPIILNRSVPCIGVYTGSSDSRTPFHDLFVNVRASFSDEMVMQAQFLLNVMRVKRIACLYQDDPFGQSGLAALASALAHVGMTLVAAGNYKRGTDDVAGAVAAIAGAASQAQAVVFVGAISPSVSFIQQFSADARTDPECIFTAISSVWSPNVTVQLERKFWSRLYFGHVVPVPGDPNWLIATNFSTAYTAWGKAPEPIAFEGYVIGRFIVEVLRKVGRRNMTRKMFLDEVYSTRLFVLDDLLLGMYSRDYPGCSAALCACNTGIRDVFLSQLDAATGNLTPVASMRYPTTQCSSSMSSVLLPILFGQLVPTWDAGWRSVALEMGRGIAQAFAETNQAGLYGGREFDLLQLNYSSNATAAMQQLSDRYPLLGSLASVVPTTVDIQFIQSSLPTVGTFDINPDSLTTGYVRQDMRIQPATALELMALAKLATTLGGAIHLRAPATTDGSAMLNVMIKSVHHFQQRPSSAAVFSSASTVLPATQSGCLIALGSEADVLEWFTSLPSFPALHLLLLSSSTMQLMAVIDVPSASHGPRLHFPTLITGKWNRTTAGPEPSEPWKYGYVAGMAAVLAIRGSEYAADSATTPADFVRAWYMVKVMTSGSVNLGPYYSDACVPGRTECQCNEGGTALAVRNGASSAAEVLFSITTCRVVYLPLQETSDVVVPASVGGVIGGFAFLVFITFFVVRLTKRNNSAAPKDSSKPFCVLFTDIQSSTHLWATIPDIMAPALDIHHALIRKLISKHKCYEVKTIGDSFMCAAHTPQQAVEMSLAIQQTFYTNDWGSEAINAVYREGVAEDDDGRISRSCWNGLRVRVGIHFGQGEVKRDPVSKGYDYYGTVVNTAARIESACHGGQIGVSQEVFDALGGSLPGSVWTDLGPHELRGLSEPIRLYQILPDGPYAMRTFPPLRVEKEDQVHEALQAAEEVAVVTQDGGSTKDGGLGRDPSGISAAGDWKWVETHPLVVHGDISAEELKKNFIIALTTLSTLLSTQTNKFKEVMLKGLCDRLHVPNCGVQGAQLQRTLKGLVHRVLPATVMNTQQSIPGSSERLSVYVTGMDAGSPASSNRVVRVRGGSAADSP